MCVVGGEVRHAHLKHSLPENKKPVESKTEKKQTGSSDSAVAAGAGAGAGAPDADDTTMESISRAAVRMKKDTSGNQGRPLKCNLICRAGFPIRFTVTPCTSTLSLVESLSRLRLVSVRRCFVAAEGSCLRSPHRPRYES